MRFDITGSAIALDAFRVTGRTASAGTPAWHAQLQLEDASMSWHKPMDLDLTAGITIKDTRPFVALLDNARGEHGWIDNLLTAENLGGHIRLAIDGDSAVIEDAMVNAAQIGVHAKGQSDASGREAMLLVRWHNLVGALQLDGDRKHFDIRDAHAKYDVYRPGITVLPFRSAVSTGEPADHTEGEGGPLPDRPAGAAGPPRKVEPAVPPPPDKDPKAPPNLFLDDVSFIEANPDPQFIPCCGGNPPFVLRLRAADIGPPRYGPPNRDS
jgi:hypothetical protein